MGYGGYGKLGYGDESKQKTPKRVDALLIGGVKAKQVSCGWEHTAVCTGEDGRVYTFGKGEYHGQLVHDEDH